MPMIAADSVRVPTVAFEREEVDLAQRCGLVLNQAGSFFGADGRSIYFIVKSVVRRECESSLAVRRSDSYDAEYAVPARTTVRQRLVSLNHRGPKPPRQMSQDND